MGKNKLPSRADGPWLMWTDAFRLPPSPGKRKNLYLSVLCASVVSIYSGRQFINPTDLTERLPYAIVFMKTCT